MKKKKRICIVLFTVIGLMVLSACTGQAYRNFSNYSPFRVFGKWVCQERNIWFISEEIPLEEGRTGKVIKIDGEAELDGEIKKIDVECHVGGLMCSIFIFDSNQLGNDYLICEYFFQADWKRGKFTLTETGKEEYSSYQENFFTKGEVLTFVLEEGD